MYLFEQNWNKMELICKWVFVCEIKFKHGTVDLVTSKFKVFKNLIPLIWKNLYQSYPSFSRQMWLVYCAAHPPPLPYISVQLLKGFFWCRTGTRISSHAFRCWSSSRQGKQVYRYCWGTSALLLSWTLLLN